MNFFIFTLLIISLNLDANCSPINPNDSLNQDTTLNPIVNHLEEPNEFNNDVNSNQFNDDVGSNLILRFRRCANWLRRMSNRYIRPSFSSLLNGNGGSIVFNSNYPSRSFMRTMNYNSNGDDDQFNYNQPLSVNHDYSNVRESNSPPQSAYIVPSSSSIAPFVETHNFVTPPNRHFVVASSARPPVVVETNEDWVHNEPEVNEAPADNSIISPPINPNNTE